MVAEDRAPPVDVGHQPAEVVDDELARSAEVGGVAEPLRRRQADRLGHHVVAVEQHVAHQVAQGCALVDRQDAPVRRRRTPPGRAEHDALGERQPAEEVPGVQPRVLDRERGLLATTAAVGDPPHLAAGALELDPAGRQLRRRRRLEPGPGERRQGRGVEVAAAPPRHVDPVEGEGEGADAGVVGRLRGLGRLDLGEPRQRGVVDQEVALDIADPGRLQPDREPQQVGDVEGGIARPLRIRLPSSTPWRIMPSASSSVR